MNIWSFFQLIKVRRILQFSLLVSAFTPLIIIFISIGPLLKNQALNRAMTEGVLAAFLVSWVFSILIADGLFGRILNNITRFCEQVKQGEYDGFSNLPNQGWDNEDENEFLVLMREMKWMSHLIKTRETELQQTIYALRTTQDELKVKNDFLLEMAMTDPLTQIYNRRYFFEHLEQEHARLHPNAHSLVVLMLDIDYFKKVNDTFGHQVGDTVLLEFANIVKQSLRKQDLFARVGGEEFAILLPDISRQDALLIASRIRKRIQEHPFIDTDGNVFYITCSLGAVIETDRTYGNTDALWRAGDLALYAAKETGRNRIYCYEESGKIEKIAEDQLIS
ncbi:MAG: GGDEF domain-containing protein [Bacillota bacterium]|nr:GGDEF domain-containing protein [Bacillota bacterium]